MNKNRKGYRNCIRDLYGTNLHIKMFKLIFLVCPSTKVICKIMSWWQIRKTVQDLHYYSDSEHQTVPRHEMRRLRNRTLSGLDSLRLGEQVGKQVKETILIHVFFSNWFSGVFAVISCRIIFCRKFMLLSVITMNMILRRLRIIWVYCNLYFFPCWGFILTN